MGIRIPPHLRDMAEQLKVQSWVEKKEFARDNYFNYIDKTRADLARFCPDGEVNAELIVPIIAQVVHAEDIFIGAVLKTGVEIKDDDVWLKMCKAAAWAIMQRYYREVENGKWKP